MGIQNFPAALQPVIQQAFLEREFQRGLRSRLGFRAIADREKFPNRIGETITKTRTGLKAPVTTPLNAASNTNLDNGLSAAGFTVEQYTLAINMYGDTIDLNTVTQGVGIVRQFMTNAEVNGVQAMQSLDRLARDALYGGYLGGNTRVTATLGAPAATIAVDDIRGFRKVFVNGVLTDVSVSNTMTVTVGSSDYTLTGATADGVNVSTAPGGISGTLTFSANVSVANGTLGNQVKSAVSPYVIYAGSGNKTTADLASGDTLTMQNVLNAVATLRSNNVPTIGGLYNCYLDDQQLLGLFADSDFKLLYRGAYGSNEYRSGQIIELLGVRFIPTNEAPQQTLSGLKIHRAIVCGQGALVEGDYADMGYTEAIPEQEAGLIAMVDDVCMVTREPLDRLKQIIAQSWYWIGGFALPSDVTANTNIIPTATNSYYKRAVVIESL